LYWQTDVFYWLFAGLGGALLGLILAEMVFVNLSPLGTLAVAAGLGILMAALVKVAKRPTIALVTLIGMGYLILHLCVMFGLGSPWNGLVAVAAGVLAAAGEFIWPSRALTVHTAIVGAGTFSVTLPSSSLPFFGAMLAWGGWTVTIVAAVLTVVGIMNQSRAFPAPKQAKQTEGVAEHEE
jgi:hypothetical protein